jgi:hypothetical protein
MHVFDFKMLISQNNFPITHPENVVCYKPYMGLSESVKFSALSPTPPPPPPFEKNGDFFSRFF